MQKIIRILHSKVIIFFVTTVPFIFFSGCKNSNNNIIPDVFVNFTLDLNDPMFNDLLSPGNTVVITSSYAGSESAGYNNHGILVYRASETKFYAFDRTCTFEEAKDQAVVIDNTGDAIAECPHCHSEYVLPGYGYPTDNSPARYPLKQYKTSFDGRFVHVYN
ncbi:MAG TPA: hypothetical protein ENK25_07630 [Bacteroidetes bacterium]|nr:hypothetical protein [Bacteroidota bacterium]